MKKNIACPDCKGNGYRTVITGDRNDYCGVANEMCPTCKGTGVQLTDMTNADRIRAMSDQQLAEFICNALGSAGCVEDHCPGHDLCRPQDGKSNGLKKWLQQPVKND